MTRQNLLLLTFVRRVPGRMILTLPGDDDVDTVVVDDDDSRHDTSCFETHELTFT